jgi:hypothetical protein
LSIGFLWAIILLMNYSNCEELFPLSATTLWPRLGEANRLRVGYNRAARIIETMEKEGLIGPSDGIKARGVYIPRR